MRRFRSDSTRGLLWVLALAGCAGVPTAPEAHLEATTVQGRFDELLPKVEHQLQERFAKAGLPSMAVGVVYQGRLYWSRGFGVRDQVSRDPVTADTVFAIGSVTKLFTGLALLQLRDEGRLRLDDPVSTYLPELGSVVYPTAEHPPILVRHLITHSSGLPRVGGIDYTRATPLTTEELFASLQRLPLDFTPGTENRYSNLAMGLAGFVVARASGLPYREFVRRRIFGQLGMTESFWDESSIPPAQLATGYEKKGSDWKKINHPWHLGAVEACGGLYSSVNDLARFAALELSAWPPRDAPESAVLSRASLRESQLDDGPQRPGEPSWGVNWLLRASAPMGYRIWHNGGVAGYSSEILLLPDRGLAVIALAGASDAELDPVVYDAALALEAAVPAPTPMLLLPASQRMQDLIDTFNDSSREYAPLFTAKFLADVPPQPMTQSLRDLHKRLGNCRLDRIEEGGVTSGVAWLACEHGKLRFQIWIDPKPPNLITGFYYFD
jgi:CubicO group peptidase (beta-lactamase class C family)